MKHPREMTDEELIKASEEYDGELVEDAYWEALCEELERRGLTNKPNKPIDHDLTWEEYKQKHYEKKLKCMCCGKFNAKEEDRKRYCPKDKAEMIFDGDKKMLICSKCGFKVDASIDKFRVELGKKGEFFCDECWTEMGDERD